MVRARRDLCPACKISGYKHPDDRTGTYYKCESDSCRVDVFRGGVQ